MGKTYRWGIIGAGRIAEKFCTALNFVEGAQVYAIASRNGAQAKSYADKFNASRWYGSYEDLMTDNQVDIVYIATPHAYHYEHTLSCIRHGKPVLCEKPMSLTYRQTSGMVSAAAANKVFLMEGMWTACMPFIARIQALLADGVIGTPQYLSADFGFTAPADKDSRLYDKKLGGGSQMDVGIYPLFLATLLFGEPAVVKTVAELTETGVDAWCNTILKYANGATAHLLSSINFNTPIEAVIVGSKGRIEIKNPWFKATDFVVKQHDGSSQEFSMPHLSNGFEHEITAVMNSLDAGLLQCEAMPHALTLSMSRTMESILQQAGVGYE